jgi:ribonuclease HI
MCDWFSHQMSISIYTDGSAPTNVAGRDNPAGWAYVVVSGVTGSNNTAELSAIYHALEYIRDNNLDDVIIYTDSMYAMNLIFGSWKPSSNQSLVRPAKELALKLHGKVIAEHVRAHQDLFWNERADQLAKQGAEL